MTPSERKQLMSIWCGMKRRCLNPKDKRFSRYGGRGISICPRWANSFDAFAQDMGPRPAEHHIDRIDNDGNYEPGNCRWVTRQESVSNRSCNIYLGEGKDKITLSEHCRRTGLNYRSIQSRLRSGHSLSRALDPTPISRRGILTQGDYEMIRREHANGASQAQLAAKFGVHQSLVSRIAHGKQRKT